MTGSGTLTGTLLPVVAIKIDGSGAQKGPSILPYSALVLGQMLTAGTATAGVRYPVGSVAQANSLFGRGSQAAAMAAAMITQAPSVPVNVVAAAEPSGAAATADLVVTGPSTAAGEAIAYVAGTRYSVSVGSGDAADSVATALAAVIDADEDAPVGAAAVTGTITLTAKHLGVIGNEIDVRGPDGALEAHAAGIAISIPASEALSSGAGVPDWSGISASVGDEWDQVVAVGLAHATVAADVDAWLETRWGATEKKGARAYTSGRQDYAAALAYVGALDSKHLMHAPLNRGEELPWVTAAKLAALDAVHFRAEPERPLRTVVVPGTPSPRVGDRFTAGEREALLQAGAMTFTPDLQGRTRIERMRSTYKTSDGSTPSNAFRDANTHAIVTYCRYDLEVKASQFATYALRDDGATLPSGKAIMTPSRFKGFLLDVFGGWERLGLVEGAQAFAATLDVRIDPVEPDRILATIHPDVVNQFRQADILMAFIL